MCIFVSEYNDLNMKKFEACVESIESIINAKNGGAHRIELCSALSEGGVTPSIGLIERARTLGPEKMHVLIRPRGGDFVYNNHEVECMINDIKYCREHKVDGVVIGALTCDGSIDMEACRKMAKAAHGMQITFHRAFDRCNNPKVALEQIISLGCTRLLTSGQKESAQEGIDLIKELVKQADGRIIIMPGAGVNEENAKHILEYTGASEIHGSLRSQIGNKLVTDSNKVKILINRINEK